jgi:hypothetical protein
MFRGGYFGAVVAIAAWAAAGCGVGGGESQSFGVSPESTRLRLTMLNAERESSSLFRYDLGDRLRARLVLTPPVPNLSIRFLLQGKSGGNWVDARSEEMVTNGKGEATVTLPPLPVGNFRAQAHFVGDARSAGAFSDLVYFRIDPPRR